MILRATTIAAAAAVTLILAAPAGADLADEQALAAKYAPVVRLVEQTHECGHGEPYDPMDVNALFGQDTVALRGPWNPPDLVKIGPAATDLVGRYESHLDFPGDPLNPGCDYERWNRRITEGTKPTVYAHVATDPDHPGKLALQYWFFYAFNDFNNTHEGDWEMIQLNFDAADASAALETTPVEIGYSSHEGAERSAWDDPKLEIVDGTHPVVYPAAGSHANKYTAALYLGSSADTGVGCDDTQGPHREVLPVVKTIPSDPVAAGRDYPWIRFDGRWGQLAPAFFNGPTGPNLKTQWTRPVEWSQGWRDRSYAVPTGGLLGTRATDFFCIAVATGSRGLVRLLRNTGLTILILAVLLLLVIVAVRRTRWRPSTPLHVARRRQWGQIVSAAGRMYIARVRLFLALGLLFIPLGAVISLVQALVVGGFGLAGVDTTGEAAGSLVLLVVTLGTTLALLGLGVVQAATAAALVEIDAGRPMGPIQAYRAGLRRVGPLFGGIAIAVLVVLALSAVTVLIPVAVWLGGRWLLLAQTVELEEASAFGGLRRSSALVRGHWLRVASLVGAGALLAFVLGPFVGALLILVTNAPLALLNVVAGVVYALTMPFVALVTSYVYFDVRAREELEHEEAPEVLPAEIALSPSA
ncbi:MAG TPA: hypothetical protein VFU10_00300 [Gaiellaceae bacterium]|nr:hypothetical protein [Gaiellaceae bacterium]